MTTSTSQLIRMDPIKAIEWGEEQNGRLELCIVMSLNGIAWSEAKVQETVVALVPDQRVHILDVRVDQEVQCTHVLLECRKEIPACFKGIACSLVSGEEAGVTQLKLSGDHSVAPGQAQLGTVEDVTPPMVSSEYPPASFFTNVGKLVETLVTHVAAPTNYGYRKLRIFSGKTPVPAGEEGFDTWMDQAVQALEEWEVADAIKRQRIVESLHAPASDVIRNLKRDKPGCTASEYLEALREVYGRIETCAELRYLFEHTYQKEGEKLSAFVTRLDQVLHQVIIKGGMKPEAATGLLLAQVLKGALPLDPIMLKLQARGQGGPLTYSQLMKTLREEEALLQAKTQTPICKQEGGVCVTQLSLNPLEEKEEETVTQAISRMTQAFLEVQTTVGKVVQLQAGMQQTIADMQKVMAGLMPKERPTEGSKCYNCGEVGHFKAQCPKGRGPPPRSREEWEKPARKPAGNARGAW